MLLLEDLKDLNEVEVKNHLMNEYEATKEQLEDLEILIGYESVGSWGCDSSSFFLLKDKEGKMYEVHGSHCSCYGFEGQFTLEETTLEALKFRINESKYGSVFYTGGYDDNSDDNMNAVKDYIQKHIK
jgi:hypothetical protein